MSMIFRAVQSRFMLNTSVDSKFIKFIKYYACHLAKVSNSGFAFNEC